MDLTERQIRNFWAKVNKTETCWLWTGVLNSQGYGNFTLSGEVRRKTVLAHRLMYLLMFGEIPEKLFVLHACDVRNCVRPSHLFLGTTTDNMRDAKEKGRLYSAKREGRFKCGHPFTEDFIFRRRNGRVTCRPCRNATGRRSYIRCRNSRQNGEDAMR